jgi:hypothetical protein
MISTSNNKEMIRNEENDNLFHIIDFLMKSDENLVITLS